MTEQNSQTPPEERREAPRMAMEALTQAAEAWQARTARLVALAASLGATPELITAWLDDKTPTNGRSCLTIANMEGETATLWGTQEEVDAFSAILQDGDAVLRHALAVMHRRAQRAESLAARNERYWWLAFTRLLTRTQRTVEYHEGDAVEVRILLGDTSAHPFQAGWVAATVLRVEATSLTVVITQGARTGQQLPCSLPSELKCVRHRSV